MSAHGLILVLAGLALLLAAPQWLERNAKSLRALVGADQSAPEVDASAAAAGDAPAAPETPNNAAPPTPAAALAKAEETAAERFEAKGIEIPFPQRVVHMANGAGPPPQGG